MCNSPFRYAIIIISAIQMLLFGCSNNSNQSEESQAKIDSVEQQNRLAKRDKLLNSEDAVDLDEINYKFSYQWNDSLTGKKILITNAEILDIARKDSVYLLTVSPIISIPDYLIKLRCSITNFSSFKDFLKGEDLDSGVGIIFLLQSANKIPLSFEATSSDGEPAELSRLGQECFILNGSFVKIIKDDSI